MDRIKILLLVCLSSLSSACTTKLNSREFQAWIADYNNGLRAKTIVDGLVFDVQYKPSSFVALDLSKNLNQDYSEVLMEADNMQYFTLTIGIENGDMDFMEYNVNSKEEQQRILYYYSYLFQQDIKLVNGSTKLPCVLYHFERSADMKNSRTFVLAFEKPKEASKESTMRIESEIFSASPIEITVKKNNIPSLEI